MIEKFTPEELAQIRAELKARDHMSQKDCLLREQMQRLSKVLYIGEKQAANCYARFDVKSAMTVLVDNAMNNYELNPRKAEKGVTEWRRRNSVPDLIAEKYLTAYTRLVDVLEEIAEPWEEIRRENDPARLQTKRREV